jgi:hypothetical protein
MWLIDRAYRYSGEIDVIGQQIACDDGRIAPLPFEGVAEAAAKRGERLLARIAAHRSAAGMIELPEIVDPMAMIGMIVGPDDRLDIFYAGVDQLLSQVRRGIDENSAGAIFDED